MGSIEFTIAQWEWNARLSGEEASFIPYQLHAGDVWWGLKVYPTLQKALNARRRQQRAAEAGLAPPVGSTARVRLRRRGRADQIWHGYLTGQCQPHEGALDCHARHWLLRRFEKAGIQHGDLHGGNVGWWNGSLVVIDFGDFSAEAK